MPRHFNNLDVRMHGEAAWVTIDRAADRNSLDSALMAQLEDCLGQLEKGPGRAVVFRGAGEDHFIGGADGIEMMQCGPGEADAFSRRIQGLFNRMESSPLILVAAIDGLCFGGGYEFALACDLRVASEEARIGLPEVKVGLIPGGGGTQRLPRLVGVGKAMELILTGRLLSGADAAQIGLVNLCVPGSGLEKAVEDLLERILRQPQYALSQAKAAVRASARMGLDAGLAVETDQFSRCFEHRFFADLMREQLRKGVLQTTTKAPDKLVGDEK